MRCKSTIGAKQLQVFQVLHELEASQVMDQSQLSGIVGLASFSRLGPSLVILQLIAACLGLSELECFHTVEVVLTAEDQG